MPTKKSPTATTSTSRRALMSLLSSLGLLLIAIAVFIPILSGGFPDSPFYKWLYSAGALVCIIAAFMTPAPPKDAPMRDRRWSRIESWSAIFFCVAAFFMWYPGATARDWLAFTLAGAVIRILVFFRSLRKSQS